MADTQAIMSRARLFFEDEEIPMKCPNCKATKKWEVSDVLRVSRWLLDRKTGETRTVSNPPLYYVHIVCRNCRYIERTYAEGADN